MPISIDLQANGRSTRRCKSAITAATNDTADEAPSLDTSKKQIVTRTNWSQGSDLITMTPAVKIWLATPHHPSMPVSEDTRRKFVQKGGM